MLLDSGDSDVLKCWTRAVVQRWSVFQCTWPRAWWTKKDYQSQPLNWIKGWHISFVKGWVVDMLGSEVGGTVDLFSISFCTH